MKFGFLLRKALELEADGLATGHYARLGFDDETRRYVLKRGIDCRKDQSYVLFSLTQNQLRYALFPIGDYVKEEVRKKAFQLSLHVHEKAESQEICFIHESSYHSFLRERLGGSVEPGPIVDRKGNVLGKHKGIPYYTIGQRRGLRLAKGEPLYVIGIDREKNTILVGGKEEVLADTFIVDGLNWIRGGTISSPFSAQVKIRYNHHGSEALLSLRGGDEIKVTFKTPQKAITPGQAAVFYDGNTVIGGGWIREIVPSSQ
jgi:tRNA-specific 2-thiouridylase